MYGANCGASNKISGSITVKQESRLICTLSLHAITEHSSSIQENSKQFSSGLRLTYIEESKFAVMPMVEATFNVVIPTV